MKMNEEKHYRDDLLEWCYAVEENWESMKPRFSKLYDIEIIKEWEESCRQLKAKLWEEKNADIEDYETAKNLYEQWELLYRESIAYPEELEVQSENHVEMDGHIQTNEDDLQPNAHREEIESESEPYIDLEELNQYRETLLEWCNNLYSNWNKSKLRLSNLVDNEILEIWEGMYSELNERLKEDLPLDYEDYETANTLYEQWKNLLDESYSNQEEIEVG
ncbi:hypothetical protein ACIQAA_14480 [Neobacillus sp. NPDC093182]|uniref:hypothetical protein n=1 Tax=Neobacillus sp. NPDC093182 TaxID=3364297 RepID=UPI0038183B23